MDSKQKTLFVERSCRKIPEHAKQNRSVLRTFVNAGTYVELTDSGSAEAIFALGKARCTSPFATIKEDDLEEAFPRKLGVCAKISVNFVLVDAETSQTTRKVEYNVQRSRNLVITYDVLEKLHASSCTKEKFQKCQGAQEPEEVQFHRNGEF